MWFAIIGSLFAVFAVGLLYLSFRAAHFGLIRKAAGSRRWLARLISLLAFLILSAVLCLLWNMMNAAVCMIHLVVFFLLCDSVSLIVSKIRKKKPERYWAGGAAIVICVVYLTGGWLSEHHVRQTDYAFESPKISQDTRIIQITDVHLGATFHADGFSEHLERINGLSPDAVVLTGDFVDDDTSREDLIAGCRALGTLRTKYGVFFVFGNHDRGYFSERSRGWSSADLRRELESNGVIILEDASFEIGGNITISGRKDRSSGARKTAQTLLSGITPGRYVVLLDHQPHEFDAEAAAGADLVLCGHTHGGQFIPINHFGEWIGENALVYGNEKRGNTDFIVSSGISNWTFKFKTGCFSEFTVIDLKAAS